MDSFEFHANSIVYVHTKHNKIACCLPFSNGMLNPNELSKDRGGGHCCPSVQPEKIRPLLTVGMLFLCCLSSTTVKAPLETSAFLDYSAFMLLHPLPPLDYSVTLFSRGLFLSFMCNWIGCVVSLLRMFSEFIHDCR